MSRLNAFMVASNVSHIATLLVAYLDSSSGKLVVASAGHPAPILIGHGGAKSLPVAPGPPLGIVGAAFGEHVFSIEDDAILFYTDGLIERRDRDPDEGMQILLAAVEQSNRGTARDLIDGITERLVTDESRADDVAILAVMRTPRHTV